MLYLLCANQWEVILHGFGFSRTKGRCCCRAPTSPVAADVTSRERRQLWLPLEEDSPNKPVLLKKALLPCYFSTETCKQSMTVWSNSMITKDCLHCRLHLRWCQFLRKVPAMLSSLQKQSCFASTRAAWRPGCRFWRITTNSWSHSCTGWGSCWSRRVLRPFFLRFRYSYFPNRMWNVINNNNLPQNHICRDWSAKYIKLFCRLQVASSKITLHYSYLVLLFYSEFKSVVCVDVFTWKKKCVFIELIKYIQRCKDLCNSTELLITVSSFFLNF